MPMDRQIRFVCARDSQNRTPSPRDTEAQGTAWMNYINTLDDDPKLPEFIADIKELAVLCEPDLLPADGSWSDH